MNIKLYTFAKKRSSTLTPNASTGTSYTCNLKDECSILAPVVTFDLGQSTSPSYNYAYIEDFARYYFIDNWSYFQGVWTADLSVDVLGTYKSSIGSSSLYVLRSASDYDSKVIDTMYPLIYKTTSTYNAASNSGVSAYNYTTGEGSGSYSLFNVTLSNGYFVIGCTADDKKGVNYYICDYAYFAPFFTWLIDTVPAGKFPDIIQAIAKAIYKPLSYLVKCYWIPCKIPGVSLNGNEVYVGESLYSPLTSAGSVSHEMDLVYDVPEYRFNIEIPEHPQSNTVGLWLNAAPYTELVLSYMPFGNIPLPVNKLAGYTHIQCKVRLDIMTGNADLFIHPYKTNEVGACIFHTTTKFGIDIPVTQSTVDILSAVGNVSQVGGTLASSILDNQIANELSPGGTSAKGRLTRRKAMALRYEHQADKEFEGAIASIPGAIGSVISGLSPHPNTVGTPGGGSSFNGFNLPKLYGLFYYTTDTDNTNRGKPLCKMKTISTLSGFTKCATGDISVSATQDEKNMISSYLTSGFYYE